MLLEKGSEVPVLSLRGAQHEDGPQALSSRGSSRRFPRCPEKIVFLGILSGEVPATRSVL